LEKQAYIVVVAIGAGLARVRELLPALDCLADVRRAVLEELVLGREDDHGNLAVAQHAQFKGLLEQAKLALGERDLVHVN